MTVITVKRIEDKKFGLFVDGVVVGWSKQSFDCHFAAQQLAKLYKESVVNLES